MQHLRFGQALLEVAQRLLRLLYHSCRPHFGSISQRSLHHPALHQTLSRVCTGVQSTAFLRCGPGRSLAEVADPMINPSVLTATRPLMIM